MDFPPNVTENIVKFGDKLVSRTLLNDCFGSGLPPIFASYINPLQPGVAYLYTLLMFSGGIDKQYWAVIGYANLRKLIKFCFL